MVNLAIFSANDIYIDHWRLRVEDQTIQQGQFESRIHCEIVIIENHKNSMSLF